MRMWNNCKCFKRPNIFGLDNFSIAFYAAIFEKVPNIVSSIHWVFVSIL